MNKNKSTKVFCFVIVLIFCETVNSQIHSIYDLFHASYTGSCNKANVAVANDVPCDYNPWVLAFQDNFDGNELNLKKWIPITGVNRDIEYEGSKQWFTPENIVLSNGILEIKSYEENLTNQCYDIWVTDHMEQHCSDFTYTSGEIWSKFKFGYGYYEINCRLPKGKGFYPAFWTYSDPWKEIDIFEFWNEDDEDDFSSIIHTNCHIVTGGNHYACGKTSDFGVDYSEDFHDFGLNYAENRLEWYVDNQLIRVDYRYSTLLGQDVGCPIDEGDILQTSLHLPEKTPMQILLTMSIQSDDAAPDDFNSSKKNFEINHFKYYKKMNCEPLHISSTGDLGIVNENYNFLAAEYIEVDGSSIYLWSGDQLEMVANDYIDLKPGFYSVEGSDLYARIDEVCPREKTQSNAPFPENNIFQNNSKLNDVGLKECFQEKPTQNSEGFLVINNQKLSQIKITISDILGKSYNLRTSIRNDSVLIDIKSLKSGIYFIEVTSLKDHCSNSFNFIVF